MGSDSESRRHDEIALVWDSARLASPHTQEDKSRRVQRMFDAIAPTYECVNTISSAGRDRYWRREMVRLAEVRPDDIQLDIACGTGDVARTFAEAAVRPRQIIGADFSASMLILAAGRPIAGGSFVQADALRLPFADASTTLVTCAFGIRNFQDLATGLREMHRVLKPNGRAVILEFSLPQAAWLRGLYLFYIHRLMPTIATWISRDRSGAYRYLPRSVVSFPCSGEVVSALHAAGFERASVHPRTFGIVSIYVAVKAS
ncbi:MAG TPA: bifunctional demethylmenaquinone methyltransferase/2-methoxy-6-polyprenyl-1,4-benzoquinol methylase UbiE [Phycisphaerae bacterium]|nr:bifunctional demethylmenaquinone methyltransferase/2-methoxy-6-polyprenyl-1,4-benzoquinol methylase UbiE [Phycisphaerae bacterium]HOJ75808.1 bifunctional demethylmenaquinone methyltransferase/2-methoxy-6-polyprenyl-1,4-benzoquinol methylase UbiE [Phycisphaerae bacterium]HOM53194.1 bifunctional demethylmenaquinone methyltransferase/2-methoxy-6-polyprenyl-1,4-benzoquinol methylase UbiE [Phycisphaerae bacterium]HON67095.1 bifunctional demethylmenaquinone methyltransferase/2-methoxy-6-polyprenyl-